ncbi:MAG TPA: AI-2E family transporter [Anaerolineaceae bacterium]|nr:AI-2E family transporter [Anaerolineaceae bacterium]
MAHLNSPSSPRWSNTTKLIIGLTLAAFLAVIVISFRSLFALGMVAIILSYLVYPLANFLHRLMRMPWRLASGIIYLLIIVCLISLLAWGGITLIEQIQNLVVFLQKSLNDLPTFISNLIAKPILIGPFSIDLTQVNFSSAVNTIMGVIQPLLAQAGTLVGSVASGAANIVGLVMLSLMLSYFIVSETEGSPGKLFNIDIPGYREDIKRISSELTIIWNAYLRSQLIVFLLVTLIYTILFSILGLQYYFGLALLAGFARFLPYVGEIISWTANGLVAFSQGSTIFGLSSLDYALMIVIVGLVTDSIIDNLITPRIFSHALKIHPAAVLITALVLYNVMGVVGMILAAPLLATAKLFIDYTTRKLLDLDPWAKMEHMEQPPPIGVELRHRGKAIWKFIKRAGARFSDWLRQQREAMKIFMRR